MDYYDGYDDEREDDEDSEYYEDRRMDDDLWDDYEYDGVEYDLEYQRSLLNPLQRVWHDFQNWLWYTPLYRRYSDWRYRREHGFSGDEIPF